MANRLDPTVDSNSYGTGQTGTNVGNHALGGTSGDRLVISSALLLSTHANPIFSEEDSLTLPTLGPTTQISQTRSTLVLTLTLTPLATVMVLRMEVFSVLQVHTPLQVLELLKTRRVLTTLIPLTNLTPVLTQMETEGKVFEVRVVDKIANKSLAVPSVETAPTRKLL